VTGRRDKRRAAARAAQPRRRLFTPRFDRLLEASAMRRQLIALLVALLVAGGVPATVLGDGDPGSDVLVYQSLFVASDAGLSIGQQVELTGVLRSAARAGVPVRVAIIAHPDDLGAVTALWHKPRAYARFLGYELSLSYKQRVVVVMPTGLGFYWLDHSSATAYRSLAHLSVGPGGPGLVAAAQAAVARLAATAGVQLPAPGTAAKAAASGSHAGKSVARTVSAPAGRSQAPAASRGGVPAVLIILLGVVVVGALGSGGILVLRRRVRARPRLTDRVWRLPPRLTVDRRRWVLPAAAVIVLAAGVLALANLPGSSSPASALAHNPDLDPGSQLSGKPAPNFTLSAQSGQPVSLDSYRGKVVMLAFTDSECTTICPLTTTAMLDAKRMLGRAGPQVQLLGVDADPKATSIQDVLSYTQLHGMLGHWRFLTGSRAQLTHVWREYGVQAAIERGLISHTPALFMIDPQGRLRKLYLTQQSYSAVPQLGQLLAREASRLLPDHPGVKSNLPYTPIPTITPTADATLPTTTGTKLRLGPGSSPRLFLFFATWDQEVTSLGGHLDALDHYQAAAAAPGAKLPRLSAVDEGSVEPSTTALGHFLAQLPGPLSYPVAIDHSGRVADGYQVQGQPWFVLTSPAGQILWYWNIDTHGWPSQTKLTADIRTALAHAPKVPATKAANEQQLQGSPAALAALHDQSGQLLGSQSALSARIHALHGYPIVLNAWASWCQPCVQEFKLFAAASATYGQHVAFIGANTDDTAGDAGAFLKQHPVSYPSYQVSTSQLHDVVGGGLEGLPTTIYINPAGKAIYVHTGEYASQGTLDADIEQYASNG
jgi:cytochrome oxidase Cu insertion factor (SCO1/SenC/PrrC family)/thiol-disulfide isomerase/thioredoxin